MPADDDPDLLPKPPPPRPAARDAAIEMALRRFDGIPDPVAHKPPARQSWIQRPQMGLLVTASLVALVGIPATLIGLRDADRNPPAEIAAPRPKMEPPRKVVVETDTVTFDQGLQPRVALNYNVFDSGATRFAASWNSKPWPKTRL